MDEKVIDSEDREQGGIVPLASSPTGKILEVYASKTRAQALSLTGSNPQALFFATDSDCIVFNGKEYVAGPYLVCLNVNENSSSDTLLVRFGKPSDLVAAVRARRPFLGWDGSLDKVTHSVPVSVEVSDSTVYMMWMEHYRTSRMQLVHLYASYSGDTWGQVTQYNEYRFSEGIYTPPAE
ncbi:hypothetical protein [Paraprevotella xylaniphila]|jgi:hypothetical protein|uniref:hypothetical protein n=1 Tax=Paraprevotella xylaniphila TaxID=454155 RepID=UPI003FD74EFA